MDRIDWIENETERTARWQSESGMPAPKQMAIVDDTIRPDDAYGLAGQGTALLWRGDFPSARHMLAAMAKRVDYRARKSRAKREEGTTPGQAFHLHRQAQAQKARLLGMLLVQLEDDYYITLPRAQDVKAACTEAWGVSDGGQTVVALRELMGVIGAHEWRTKGLEVPGLGGRIHPHYGVFTPTRSEYLDLIAKATFPAAAKEKGVAFDIGTGTGVLAAMLARHAGIARIVATDIDPRSLACAPGSGRNSRSWAPSSRACWRWASRAGCSPCRAPRRWRHPRPRLPPRTSAPPSCSSSSPMAAGATRRRSRPRCATRSAA